MANFKEENNPNWKGGISKNHYFYTKKHRKKYPEQHKAHSRVARAIQSGKLIRPKYCQHQLCFETKIFAHHISYEIPLAVLWFCTKHHNDIHNNKYDPAADVISQPEQISFFK
jgi:hypothetical protein